MDAFVPDLELRDYWNDLAVEDGEKERTQLWITVPELPERPEESHKGTFGTTLVVAGSRGMAGAAALTGAAALVAGSGLVRVLTPESVRSEVAGFQREYTTIGAPEDEEGRLSHEACPLIREQASRATVVAVGPGLGISRDLDQVVDELFLRFTRTAVVDADALNALARLRYFEKDGAAPEGARILTPHPGEFERLAGFRADSREFGKIAVRDLLNMARVRLLRAKNPPKEPLVVLLKGHKSWIGAQCSDYRDQVFHQNETGNSNLATGGSGDVLTGIIAGLAAQGMTPYNAAIAGAALHGIAAELRFELCSRGAVASDIIRFLPAAFDYYETASKSARALTKKG